MIIRLTAAGLALVEQVVTSHLAVERELLSSLTPRQRDLLGGLMRTILVDLGDRAEPGTARAQRP